jgi:predicted GIY-YIG superfamily endonuclease
MVNYKTAKIYKLVSGNLTYYGSTCNELRKRLAQHKASHDSTLRKLFDSGEEVKIILVEKYPCNDRDELNARLRYYIENNKCIV